MNRENNLLLRNEIHLCHIFPYEIWEIVLSRAVIQDGYTAENVSNASPFFRHILLKGNVLSELLFSKVWKILGTHYHRKYQTDASYNHITVEGGSSSVPQLRACSDCFRPIRFKWFSDILNMRLVCHAWCDGIDQFYQSAEKLQDENYRGQDDKLWLLVTNEDLSYKFMQHFRHTHADFDRNPMIGREVVIILGPGIDNEFQTQLDTYGRHVWYCTIGICVQFKRKNECYFKLNQILSKLPNLKGLFVHFGHFGNGNGIPGKNIAWGKTKAVGAEAMPRRFLHQIPYNGNGLEEELRTNPLPTLENLELLIVTDLPEFIKQVLMAEYGNRVKFRECNNNNVEWVTWEESVQTKGDSCYQTGLYTFESEEDWDWWANRHLNLQ